MAPGSDRLQALRNCCRDEAAFAQLQKILASEAFGQAGAQASESIGTMCQSPERPSDAMSSASPTALSLLEPPESVISHSSLLQGVAAATSQLLTRDDYPQALGTALATLGQATGADRVYISEIHPHPVTGEMATSQRFEWVQDAIAPQMDNPALQNCTYAANGLMRWSGLLQAGQSVCGLVEEFPAPEQAILRQQGIQSILLLPVQIKGEVWGFVGFDDCHQGRRWSPDEEALLRMMADSLGGAIARQQAEIEWRQSEVRYSAMLDASPDLMFRISREGQYLDFKGNAMAHIPREHIVGRYVPEMLPAEVATLCMAAIHKALETGALQTCQYQLPTPQGPRDYEARLVVSGLNEVLTVVQDITDRKQAEKNLRASEDRLQSFFEATFEAVIIHDFGTILDVNPAGEALFGYSAAELIGMPVLNLVAPISKSAVQQQWQSLASPDAPYAYEGVGLRKDGTTFRGSVVAKAAYYKGQRARVAGIRDITAQKEAETKILQSEARHRALVNAVPDLMFRIRRDGTYLDCKAEQDSYILQRPEELIGKTVYDVLPSDIAFQRMAYIERALATGENQDFEYKLQVVQPNLSPSMSQSEESQSEESRSEESRSEDAAASEQTGEQTGEQTIVRDYEARIVVSGEDEVLAIVRDITERKRAEQQLWAATERDRLLGEMALRIRQSLDLDQILNTTVAEVRQLLKADRVYIVHTHSQAESRIVAESVDPAWRSLLGQAINDSAQVQGMIERLVQDGRAQVIHDAIREIQEPWLAAYHHEYHIRASLVMPLMLNEQPFGGLCVNQCRGARQWEQFEVDLLERLATQVTIAIQQAQLYRQVQDLNTGLEGQVAERTAQLQQKMEELQELNDLKDEFLNAFSHDLRTPVMGMSLVLNNLLNQSSDTLTITRSIVQRMLQSSEHQLNLINSLLQAHSSETRGIVLQYELLQLSWLTQMIVEDLELLIEKNQATMTNLVPTDLPLVTADPVQLRRVFENLITNALHHNPPGIDLVLNATVEAEMIRFTLSDNGVGMPPEVCDRLFTRYSRGPKSRHSTGIGLGLYLCRQIITAHGGQIGVNSVAGKGSSFWLTLPLAIPAVEPSNPVALADG